MVPPSRTRSADAEDSLEVTLRKVKAILNKLTPEMFEDLFKDIEKVPIKNREALQGTIELIFDKVVDEPHHSSMYAKLYEQLNTSIGFIDQEKKINLRRLLLDKCQQEFERKLEDEVFIFFFFFFPFSFFPFSFSFSFSSSLFLFSVFFFSFSFFSFSFLFFFFSFLFLFF